MCWIGSLSEYAMQVLPYCEQAVLKSPLAGNHDSRGLARALTGDYAGAIEDFQFVVDQGAKEGLPDELILQRQQWIEDLKAGKNPFTPELLEKLKYD
jgi:hypothetical protein